MRRRGVRVEIANGQRHFGAGAARARAVSAPMPELAPVTMTLRFVRSIPAITSSAVECLENLLVINSLGGTSAPSLTWRAPWRQRDCRRKHFREHRRFHDVPFPRHMILIGPATSPRPIGHRVGSRRSGRSSPLLESASELSRRVRDKRTASPNAFCASEQCRGHDVFRRPTIRGRPAWAQSWRRARRIPPGPGRASHLAAKYPGPHSIEPLQ